MTTAARIPLVVCFFLALYGVIFASLAVTNKHTVQEADFWKAAGCDEQCLYATPRVSPTMDFSDLF